MSELIHQYSENVLDSEDRAFTARIRGETDVNGHWQGWIEFVARDGSAVFQTGRETTQSKRDHLEYWASGLSQTYMEQALARAQRAETESPKPPPPLPEIREDDLATDPEASGVHVIEIESLDPQLPRRLMGLSSVSPGTLKRVPGAGVLVLDEVEAPEGGTTTFRLRAQVGSKNTGAVNMGNRLWSALRDEGATLRIDDRPVDVTSHDIIEALRR